MHLSITGPAALHNEHLPCNSGELYAVAAAAGPAVSGRRGAEHQLVIAALRTAMVKDQRTPADAYNEIKANAEGLAGSRNIHGRLPALALGV